MSGLNESDFFIEVACQEVEGIVTMDEAQTLINAHYEQMHSSRSSYEIIPPDSEDSKSITEYNKARRPELYK